MGEGDEVLITEMEHHSNIVPWQILCEEKGARLRYVPVADSGELALDELDAILGAGRVKLLAVAHVSNVLGTVNPIADIVAPGARGGRGHRRRRRPGSAAAARGPRASSTRTSTPGPGTRRWAPRWACYTAGTSCWPRCRPS